MERTDEIGFGGLRLTQETEDFCYGIDAVLLAGAASGPGRTGRTENKAERIADLGTGNGIVPLILSSKLPEASIVGIESDEGRAALAVRNVKDNGLEERVEIIRADILDIPGADLPERESFDIVTMNPPYVKAGAGLKSGASARMTARHETTAGIDDFMRTAAALLKPKGEAVLVHRPSRLVDIMTAGRNAGLEAKELRLVVPRRGEKANICLVRFTKGGGAELDILPELIVRNDDGTYTAEIEKIYERR